MATASDDPSLQPALRRVCRKLRATACALTLSGASLAIPSPALAETDAVVDAAIGFLEAQGYHIEEVERTWLGRVRIEAVRGKQERELVLNPRTGEVLRDFIEDDDDDGGSDSGSRASSGEGGYDDDYGDDGGYDHDDDSDDSSDDGHDNSGSGSDSDNSGSGGGDDGDDGGSDSDNSGSGSDSSGSGGGDDGGDDD